MISWMVIQNRMPTFDRLASWGLMVDETCSCCANGRETKDHIFIECAFAKQVWMEIHKLCGIIRPLMNWPVEIHWAVNKFKGKALLSMILRLAWMACISHVWHERNVRVYGKGTQIVQQIVNRVKEEVTLKHTGIKKVAADAVNKKISHT
ncbi:hypothetical protein PTKIN_Ptkin14bG0182000 [Pterospermum kingtungense]